MSGIHIVGDVGRFEGLLRTWARNGLQAVLSVKPEGSNGALLRSILPNGTLVGRITNNSTLRDTDIQQRYEADPKAAAAWIFSLYLPTMLLQLAFTCWQFQNEPVFGNDPATRLFRIRRLCEFMRELIDLANARGFGVALFNFARGTPEPSEWIHFHEVWRYALSKNRTLPAGRKNILCLHQYGSFNKAGAGSLFYEQAWHIKRFEMQVRPSLPADLKAAEYLINESGPDGGQPHLKGWKEVYGQNDAGRGALVTDWRIYNEWLAQQAGCLGSCFFTLGQEGSFDTFNIENDPVAQMLASTHYPTMKPATIQPAPPPSVPPTGGTMTLTDKFIQLARAKWGNKFEDLRATLPKHATLKFNPIDSRLMQYICFHHTATAVNTTWKRIAEAHIAADPARNKEEWAGIGYHLGFRQGKVSLLADLDTQRAHVKGRNHEALGLVWMGNSDTVPVPDGDKALMREMIQLLDELYARDKELTWHGKMLPAGYTECPGSSMKQIVPTLRAPVAPPVPPPSLQWAKIVWQGEDAMRAEEREGRAQNAEWIRLNWVEPAIRERDRVSA